MAATSTWSRNSGAWLASHAVSAAAERPAILAIWIDVGFILQGVAATTLAIEVPALPDRGWYAFVGVLTVIAGVVTLVWPISSIVVLAITAGIWLVVSGITEIVWAVSARRSVREAERPIEESLAPSTAG
jgi:uncharacterized membrane protein HdeD (DUF308 family)